MNSIGGVQSLGGNDIFGNVQRRQRFVQSVNEFKKIKGC